MTTRLVHKTNWQCRADARELLQGIFASELLLPSRCLWIVSPWVSDVPVLDNAASTFRPAETAWGQRSIRLAELLLELARLGTTAVVATRPDPHNRLFLDQANQLFTDAGLVDRLVVRFSQDLHEKGIAGDGFYLGGSMNLTNNGVEVLEEALYYSTNAETVALVRLRYRDRWGGPP